MAISEFASIEFASRLAAGADDPATLQWVKSGFSTWVRSGCEIPLERCLGLPRTPSRHQLLQRNVWIKTTAKLLDGPSQWRVACDLADALDTFLSRGPWLAWQGLSEPPAGASQLRASLFHIANSNAGKSLTPKQFHRVLRRASD